jgi:hypothetical protein
MTDQDVIDLYRCLLGRAPEAEDTIAAFRHYYPDFDIGRKAILESDEFRDYAARVTGRVGPRGDVAGRVAFALLMQASGTRTPAASDDALRAGFALQIAGLDQARLALMVGDDTDSASIDDLAPMGGEAAAVLHVASVPRPIAAARLADGTSLLTGPWRPEALCRLLAEQKQTLDAVFLLGPPAEAALLPVLLPLLSSRALLAIDLSARWGGAALSALVTAVRSREAPLGREPPLAWRGFAIHHLGSWPLPVRYAPRTATMPDPNLYPAVAVAAIVRNEASCVVNMLQSALPFASFYAVLDTGSDDATPALVQGFFASCAIPSAFAQIGHETFDDRFDAMRNAALDMVPDWVEWVLMLDADEEMAPEDTQALLALVEAGTHAAYALPRYNYVGADKSGQVTPYPDRQVRLLRHGQGRRPRYSGAVHETVRDVELGMPPLDASAIGGPAGGPHIHHLVRRFRNAEAEEQKQSFYRGIAKRHAAPG